LLQYGHISDLASSTSSDFSQYGHCNLRQLQLSQLQLSIRFLKLNAIAILLKLTKKTPIILTPKKLTDGVISFKDLIQSNLLFRHLLQVFSEGIVLDIMFQK